MIWNHGINFLSVPGTQPLISVMNSTSAGYSPGLGSCINYFYCTTVHYREDGQVQPFSTDPWSGLPQDVFEISVTKGLFGFSLTINCFPLCTHRKIHNGWIDWKVLHLKKGVWLVKDSRELFTGHILSFYTGSPLDRLILFQLSLLKICWG